MENINLKAGQIAIKKCLDKNTSIAQIAAVGYANSLEEEGNRRVELLEFIKDWSILTENLQLEKDVGRMLYKQEDINL